MSKDRSLNSLQETTELAKEIASQLKGGETLLLVGELGSGKTAFSQALIAYFDVKQQVSSPTFTIMSEYETESFTIVHVDLYRLEPAQVATDPAAQEVLEHVGDKNRVTIIEWADRLEDNAPQDAMTITFKHGDSPDQRIATVSHG